MARIPSEARPAADPLRMKSTDGVQQTAGRITPNALRAAADGLPPSGPCWVSNALNGAAAEIERLRSALGKIATRYPPTEADVMRRFAQEVLGDGWEGLNGE